MDRNEEEAEEEEEEEKEWEEETIEIETGFRQINNAQTDRCLISGQTGSNEISANNDKVPLFIFIHRL